MIVGVRAYLALTRVYKSQGLKSRGKRLRTVMIPTFRSLMTTSRNGGGGINIR